MRTFKKSIEINPLIIYLNIHTFKPFINVGLNNALVGNPTEVNDLWVTLQVKILCVKHLLGLFNVFNANCEYHNVVAMEWCAGYRVLQ